jgi:hypothetical protein
VTHTPTELYYRQRFTTLSNATNDIITWRLDFYRYALAFRPDRNTVDHRVTYSCRLD